MTILEIFSIQTLHLIVKQLLEKKLKMRGKNYKTSLTNFSMFCYYQSNIFKHVCTTKRKSNKTFICGIHCVKGHMFILKTCLKH